MEESSSSVAGNGTSKGGILNNLGDLFDYSSTNTKHFS